MTTLGDLPLRFFGTTVKVVQFCCATARVGFSFISDIAGFSERTAVAFISAKANTGSSSEGASKRLGACSGLKSINAGEESGPGVVSKGTPACHLVMMFVGTSKVKIQIKDR